MSSTERGQILLTNFTMSTWLTTGACLQSALFLILPRYVALLPAALLLTSRLVTAAVITKGYAKNPYLPERFMQKMSAPIPNEDGSELGTAGDRKVVCFVVGANHNHPLGIFSPGFKTIADYFSGMWVEAEANREKWGFLGKSTNMTMPTPNGGQALLTISYWRSVDHLHAFARSDTHKAGWDWFRKIERTHTHIGIMHETFSVPEKGWENVYQNFWPVGMGQAEYLVKGKEGEEPKLINPLVNAKEGKWRSMRSRMGGEEGVY